MPYDYDRARRAARPIPVDKPALAALAKQFVRELPKHLPPLGVTRNPAVMDEELHLIRGYNQSSWGFDLGKYEVTTVHGTKVKVPVLVRASGSDPRPTRLYISGGSVQAEFYSGSPLAKHTNLKLKLWDERTPNKILTNLKFVEKEAFSVLIHEVTHLRDRFTLREEREHAADSPGNESYHNRPSEVRAFMQQIADEVIGHVEGQAKSVGIGTWGVSLNGRLIERALETSATWDRIKRDLTPSNERLVLRGVERALRDEWPRLQKTYPSDDDV